MAVRPTDYWRTFIAKEEHEVAAGNWVPRDAFWARHFPESLLSSADEALFAYERELQELSGPSDEQVLGAVKHVVLALNTINEGHGQHAYFLSS